MLAVNVILKNEVQKRTFIVINKSIIVKLQRTFVKFVTVNTNPSRLLSAWGRFYNFIKLKTMKAVTANMDQKEPDKATKSL